MKFYILSPIPPQQTGTAVYFGFFLRDLKEIAENLDVTIVVDELHHDGPVPETFDGYPVIKNCNFVPRRHDVLLIFLANNTFHQYCYEELLRNRSERVVTFIHDVQVAMIMMHMCATRYASFDKISLMESLGGQFGQRDKIFMEWFESSLVPPIAAYAVGCHGLALRNSKIIVVHSYHAALKLQLEYTTFGNYSPHLLVMQHPHADIPPVNNKVEADKRFIIGVFGWLSKSKRVELVFRTFHRFLDSLNSADRERVALRLVGKIIPQDFDVKEEVHKSRFSRNIEYYDYVPKDEFEMLLSQCSVLVNLRFPSCGETSGTLIHAETYKIPTVAAAYQSFFEEDADFKVSIDPQTEQTQLLKIFNRLFIGTEAGEIDKLSRSNMRPKLDVLQAFGIIRKKIESCKSWLGYRVGSTSYRFTERIGPYGVCGD